MHAGMGPYPQNNSMGNYGPQGAQYGPQGEASGQKCWRSSLVDLIPEESTALSAAARSYHAGFFFFSSSNPKNIMNEFYGCRPATIKVS